MTGPREGPGGVPAPPATRRSHSLDTVALRAGMDAFTAGPVAPSIVLSNTFLRDADGGYPSGHMYGRMGNPNRDAFETALAAMEDAAGAVAFASGSAATWAVCQALLRPGDRAVFPAECYFGTGKLVREALVPWGVDVAFADLSDPAVLRNALSTARTRLLWVETPSNPTLRATDIADAALAAREAGTSLAVDNTWSTPVGTRPLTLGATLSIHSVSKYIGGHGDLIAGAVAVADTPDGRDALVLLRTVQTVAGAVAAPFDCWLAHRGLRTLPVRFRAQCAAALAVARAMDGHPGIDRVHYPGLTNDEGHAIALRQMAPGLFGAMLALRVRGGAAAARRVASATRLFTQATSLGGIESLIEHRASVEGPATTTPDDLLRLSVGLEDPGDLIADLEQALGS